MDSYQHIVPARIHEAGSVFLSAHYSTFKTHHVFTSHNARSGIVLWDTFSRIGLYYAATSHIEVGFVPTLFQHNHHSNHLDFPSQVHALARLGSYTIADSAFMFGMQVSSRLPFHKRNNIPLQPYSTKRIGFGLSGMLSFLPSGSFESWQIHANLGLYDHNDTDLVLTDHPQDSLVNDKSTKELFYGVSVQKQWQGFAVYAELYGSFFLQQPPLSAYTRENSFYLNPGLVYRFNNWINLNVSLDVLLLGQQDKTRYDDNGGYAEQKWRTLPNLPTWRLNAGLSFALYSPSQRQEHSGNNREENSREIIKDRADPFSVSRQEFIEKLRNNQEKSQEEFLRLYEKVLEEDRERRKEIMQKLHEQLEKQRQGSEDEEEK